VQSEQLAIGDPYTVLRIGPGPALGHDPEPRAIVQVMTTGADPDAVLKRSQTVFETLCGDDPPAGQVAARMLTIPGYKADDDSGTVTGS
jgi:hypothetical protein